MYTYFFAQCIIVLVCVSLFLVHHIISCLGLDALNSNAFNRIRGTGSKEQNTRKHKETATGQQVKIDLKENAKD